MSPKTPKLPTAGELAIGYLIAVVIGAAFNGWLFMLALGNVGVHLSWWAVSFGLLVEKFVWPYIVEKIVTNGKS